jgi:hypothetical protein
MTTLSRILLVLLVASLPFGRAIGQTSAALDSARRDSITRAKIGTLPPAKDTVHGLAGRTPGSQTGIPITASVKSVEIISQHSDHELWVGDFIKVTVNNPDSIMAHASHKRLMLFLDKQPVASCFCDTPLNCHGEYIFQVNRDSSLIWKAYFSYKRVKQRNVLVSVGLEGDCSIESSSMLKLVIVLQVDWTMAILFLLAMVIGVIWLGIKSDMLRDGSVESGMDLVPPPGPVRPGPLKAPFSLGRTQLAFWTLIVVGSYLGIWVITHDFSTLTPSIIALLGISIVGTGAAKMIDANQGLRGKYTGIASEGFFTDILSDRNDGVSIHRLQMVLWTVVFGWIFIREVIVDLKMPSFDEVQLGLMGISTAGYLLLKAKEAVPGAHDAGAPAPVAPVPAAPVVPVVAPTQGAQVPAPAPAPAPAPGGVAPGGQSQSISDTTATWVDPLLKDKGDVESNDAVG